MNRYLPSFEVMSKSGYNIESHGDLSNTPQHLITNDFPDYAALFYSPTEHEVVSSIKYGNFTQGYDNLIEMRESMNGPPMELYVPSSFNMPDGVGKSEPQKIPDIFRDKLLERVNKEALDEIRKAQSDITGMKIKRIEFEDTLLFRKIKRTIIFEE